MEQSESNEAQRKLELIEKCLKAVEGSDVYGLVNAYSNLEELKQSCLEATEKSEF